MTADLAWQTALAAFRPKPRRWSTPGVMALDLDPAGTRQTAALHRIDQAIVGAAEGITPRLMVFMPPQEGKSQRVSRRTPAWLLEHDPSLRIAIVSYSDAKAARWGRQIRRDIQSHPDLNITLREDSRAAGRWETDRGGGLICVGVAGGITGEPVDVMIIDDPVAGRKEAESATYRETAWDWWESNGSTRLSTRFGGRGVVILMMCMTGDTPVLLPDGTEKPLRDVRPGDEVATYEGGGLTTSTVMNWANQGPDDLFRIRMKSGRVVRANARHPFLTIDANGEESWLRTDQIRPGVRILTATGGSGAEPPASLTNATCRRAARGCATPTTTKLAGRPVTAHLRSTLQRVAEPALNIVTASPMRKSTSSSTSRAGTAPSADGHRQTATPEPTGMESCASITTTTPETCADCSATTATSPSDTGNRRRSSGLPLTTWSATPDEVAAVEACGREDVFDLQIARTENFIANGLVSHNTRWHEDDLAGRLLTREPGEWTVLRIPAVAEEGDPLGRAPGEELESVQGRPPGYFADLQVKRTPYVWLSIYQQAPSAAEGLLFKRLRWRFWRPAPSAGMGQRINVGGQLVPLAQCWRFATIDLAASTRTSADFTVAAAWALTVDGNLVLLDRTRARVGEERHFDLVRPLAEKWQLDTAFVEAGQFGTTLVKAATRSGLSVTPLRADVDKTTRALPYSDHVHQGLVWLPADADWREEWITEHAQFPNGTHDDQVDVGAYAVRVAVTQWAPPIPAPQRPAEPEIDLMTVPM